VIFRPAQSFVAAQQRGDLLPFLPPERGNRPECDMTRRFNAIDLFPAESWPHINTDSSVERFQEPQKGVGRGFLLQGIAKQRRGMTEKVLPPEVIDKLLQQRILIGHYFGIVERTAFKRMILQGTQAKAVNGENGGGIKRVERRFRPPCIRLLFFQRLCISTLIVLPLLIQLLIVRPLLFHTPHIRLQQGIESFADPFADSRTQLLGCRFGVGNHKNLIGRQLFFKQETQIERCYGVGFARSGTGFDEIHAGKVNCKMVEPVHRPFFSSE